MTEVEQLLADHAITPERLVLEITESLVLDPGIKPVIASLRALGVQLALDDFGTGYSSLGSLQRFPLDLLKLDRTLIDSLRRAEASRSCAPRSSSAVRSACHVIAEGIEARTQLDTLRDARLPARTGLPVRQATCPSPTPSCCCTPPPIKRHLPALPTQPHTAKRPSGRPLSSRERRTVARRPRDAASRPPRRRTRRSRQPPARVTPRHQSVRRGQMHAMPSRGSVGNDV